MLDQLMRLTSQQGSQFYQLLQPLSENFANYNTYGYKARRFEMYLRPDGVTDLVLFVLKARRWSRTACGGRARFGVLSVRCKCRADQ